MESGGVFCEDLGNTARREGAEKDSHGYWAALLW